MSEKGEPMKELQTIDKSTWPDGPWKAEPDRVEFEHAGLPCLLNRTSVGNWCGYAAVLPGHPLHGRDFGGVDLVEVHGGLTYASACSGDICHVPRPNEPDDVWWFGFDCAHAWDTMPTMADNLMLWDGGASYKTRAYVEAQTRQLAEQLSRYVPE